MTIVSNNTRINQISLVIPSSNDDDKLNKLIEHILANSKPCNIKDIIIVRNGDFATDKSVVSNNKIKVLYCSKQQRAAAMNLGAGFAKGNILYFLHTDSLLPNGFDEQIIRSYSQGAGAGCFLLKFDSSSRMLKIFCLFVRLPWYWVHFGDQSLFVDASVFKKIGGFDENLTTMEDVDIVKRIKKHVRFEVIKDHITTSARKYEKYGYYRVHATYVVIIILYLLKAPQPVLLNILSRLRTKKVA